MSISYAFSQACGDVSERPRSDQDGDRAHCKIARGKGSYRGAETIGKGCADIKWIYLI